VQKLVRIQWIIFIFVLILVIFELFYLFFYKPLISKKLLSTVLLPTTAPKAINVVGIPFDLNERSASQNGDQIKEIIFEAQTKKRNFISYNSLLKAVMIDAKNCKITKNCFQSQNTEKTEWKNDVDHDFPITISGSFLVKMNLSGNKMPSGINLTGRLATGNKFLWQGFKNIFFGVGNDGKRLYIDAKNSRPYSFLLFDQTFENKIEGIYILFNEKGTSFLVTDLSYNKITFIDLDKATDGKFPGGLFPDKQFYIGYVIAPLSDLTIYDLSVL